MHRIDLVDLNAFIAVAEARSFTRAAAKLGTSQSALSHALRRLEARLGVRLLTRTTRSVSPTQAGERLLGTLTPAFEDINVGLETLSEFRERPAGTIRITTSAHAAQTILWPALRDLLPEYPDIHVELSADSGLRDIVAERFDAGVRLGEQVEKDMIAVRISPELRMAAVASPAYVERHGQPASPQDLAKHQCINLRLPTYGGFYAWEFEKDGRALNVRVESQFACNNVDLILAAARDGVGIAYLLEDHAQASIDDCSLVRLLADWSPPFAGYYLYYPSRRQNSPAFSLLVDRLRYRG